MLPRIWSVFQTHKFLVAKNWFFKETSQTNSWILPKNLRYPCIDILLSIAFSGDLLLHYQQLKSTNTSKYLDCIKNLSTIEFFRRPPSPFTSSWCHLGVSDFAGERGSQAERWPNTIKYKYKYNDKCKCKYWYYLQIQTLHITPACWTIVQSKPCWNLGL